MSIRSALVRPVAVACCAALALVFAACGGDSAGPRGEAIVREVPFGPGEELRYGLFDEAGALVGRGTLTVTAADGGLQLAQRYEATQPAEGSAPAADTSTVLVTADTLQPRRSDRVVDRPGEPHRYSGEYASDGSVTISRLEGDEDDRRAVALNGVVYDNESSLWLWRTLGLSESYEARYVSVNIVDRSRQTVSLAVTARERIEVPAGAFDTWRLQVRNGRATRVAWINVEAPRQVVQWDNGEVIFRLEAAR